MEFAATAPPRLLGIPAQLVLVIIIFSLLGIAFLLERKRIASKSVGHAP